MSIIGSMTGIDIKSSYFQNAPTFELFPKTSPDKQYRVALLYGKNGSGKSTIAQGFRDYRDITVPTTVELWPRVDGTRISMTDGGKPEKFFIFDDKYITSEVRIKDAGLDAIVLFGEQVGLSEQIEEVERRITSKKNEVTQQEAKCAQFLNDKDINAPDYWLTKIRNELRKDTAWAGIGAKIKGKKHNLSVTEAEIDRIGHLVPKKPQIELQAEFDSNYAQYTAVDSTSNLIITKITPISIVHDLDKQAKMLFETVVAQPRLTEREQRLLTLFGLTGVTGARVFLADIDNAICDRCFQPIRDEYRTEVLTEIECILNRDVEEFKDKLEKLRLAEIPISSYQVFRDLPSYCVARDLLEDCNKAIVAHNDALHAKVKNPFDTMEYDDTIGVLATLDLANQALITLESDRVSYNRNVEHRDDVKTELLDNNDDLAHYAIVNMYNVLQKQRTAKQRADEELRQENKNLAELEDQKAKLDAQRKNVQLAVDEINRSLEYIFYCKGRLVLDLGPDQNYHLKSNGHPVNPDKVSCGERNALALCYFFTQIARNTNADSIYSEEVFLVIDDPVSSFDSENRIGVLSLLRWKMEQVLGGCATSKVLIMTHDAGTVFDLDKAQKEISARLKDTGRSADYSRFELKDRTMSKISDNQLRNWNEYTQLLERIYDYAKSGVGDELVIGNIMRRVLEAFSTFTYKKSIDAISTDESILAQIKSASHREYFKSLMYRLVLHGESHYADHIKVMKDYRFFGFLSVVEKQRTAKDILCFMFLLNEIHVLAHLPSAEPDIAAWCADINGEAWVSENVASVF